MIDHVSGFSKLTKEEKIDWLQENYFKDNDAFKRILKQYWNTDEKLQKLHDEFIENTISNFYLPLGVAPNFLINGKLYTIPMAIEESSVVAAASNASKFWLKRGGFTAEVISTVKNGQVHFDFLGDAEKLRVFFDEIKPKLLESVSGIAQKMEKRGGGVLEIELKDKTTALDNYYQLHCTFETKDAMGANFINSCLEQFATTLEREARDYPEFTEEEKNLSTVMSILSNYVPECLVIAKAECKVEKLATGNYTGQQFAERFVRALDIADAEPRRAVTHNKGIMNGIDAVVLATGNDFRAVEAGIHAYACQSGNYKSLTKATVENGIFTFSIEIPLAIGTVGGLTGLHPLVKVAHAIMENPNAPELMQIIAVAGLAQNFAAVRSLITTGIQQGHMKMHLMNILNQLQATDTEKQKAVLHFKNNIVTYSSATDYINNLRK